jgi:hypothetical protein
MITWFKYYYKLLSPKYKKHILEYPLDLRSRYNPPHKKLLSIVNNNREVYSAYIAEFLKRKKVFEGIKQIKDVSDVKEPGWNNGFLPGLDIISLYTMIGVHKPSVYMEIGSGNSTKVARKSINDHGLMTSIVSIDPTPRVEIDQLATKVIRKGIERVDLSILDELGNGDILYVDNSHICAPNSDVTVFFLDILPRLKPGVIVHLHDIYLPYDYPEFMIQRYYSEQYLLATYLLFSLKYEILFPCYFVSEDKELNLNLAPIWESENLRNVERHGGSFWFKISEIKGL